jgi:hypothetical protein
MNYIVTAISSPCYITEDKYSAQIPLAYMYCFTLVESISAVSVSNWNDGHT